MKIRYPNEIQLLEARDIHKGSLSSKDGKRHCLMGWTDQSFIQIQFRVNDIIEEVINQELGFRCDYISRFNDSRKISKSLIARVWNRAMYLLGYTVGNPEDKPLTWEDLG